LEPYAQVLERAVAGDGQLKNGTDTSGAFHLTLLGLFAYRRGDYAKALEDCQSSLVASTYLAMPSAEDRVIRAMSFHKLGDDASARSELDGARRLVQSGLNIGFDKWNWSRWVYFRVLLREADDLIPQAPPPEQRK
jgi:hypothetical protein